MAISTTQPSLNLFMTFMDNWKRLFCQDRSDLRSHHLPFATLLHKCIGPDKFAAEKILRSVVRFDHALADHYSCVAIYTYAKIIDFELGKKDVAGHRL